MRLGCETSVRRSHVLQGRWLSTNQYDSLLLTGGHSIGADLSWEELAALSTGGHALVSGPVGTIALSSRSIFSIEMQNAESLVTRRWIRLCAWMTVE